MQWNLMVLWPVLAPALAAVLVVVLDVLAPARISARAGVLITAGGLAAAIGTALPGLLQGPVSRREAWCAADGSCLYAAGSLSSGLQILAAVSAGIVLALSAARWWRAEPAASGRSALSPAAGLALLSAATAGAMLIPAARDLAPLIVAVHLVAILPGVLALIGADSRVSWRAALPWFLTAFTSLGLMSLGAALWVAATGTTALNAAAGLGGRALGPDGDPPTMVIALAVLFLIAGSAFLLSAAPFHLWTPASFSAAPAPIALYLATTTKVAGLGVAVVVVQAVAGLPTSTTLIAIGALAVVTMLWGNLMALRQTDLLRLLAYSAVAQAGWVLLPLTAGSARGAQAAVGYLTVYLAATIVAFLVVLATRQDRGTARVQDHRGLLRSRPLTGLALGFALLTLAGLPPAIVGTVAKLVALRPIAGEGIWWLAVIAALNVALGIAVYLRWLAAIAERTAEPAPRIGVPVAHRVVIGLLTLGLVAFSIAPVGLW